MKYSAMCLEFPFVESLPKREKAQVVGGWQKLAELRKLVDRNGAVLPLSFAADLLNISRQRVHVLVEDGRLPVVEWNDQRWIAERDLVAFAETERKIGRPLKPRTKLREIWRIAKESQRK